MRVRVSIANMTPRICVEGDDRFRFFGIMNKGKLKKGVRQINPLGGAALLTTAGNRFLKTTFNAELQEGVGNGMDARFFIDDSRLEEVLNLFAKREEELYEIDPNREILDELTTKDLPNQEHPILSPQEGMLITTKFVKTVRQVPGRNPTSALETKDVPTYRLFNLFDITAPQQIVDRILGSQFIRTISGDQVQLTQKGVLQETADGCRIGDNFMM